MQRGRGQVRKGAWPEGAATPPGFPPHLDPTLRRDRTRDPTASCSGDCALTAMSKMCCCCCCYNRRQPGIGGFD